MALPKGPASPNTNRTKPLKESETDATAATLADPSSVCDNDRKTGNTIAVAADNGAVHLPPSTAAHPNAGNKTNGKGKKAAHRTKSTVTVAQEKQQHQQATFDLVNGNAVNVCSSLMVNYCKTNDHTASANKTAG